MRVRAAKSEDVSHMIDRLVLGIPRSEELTRRIRRMHEEDLTYREIGEAVGLSRDAVEKRLSRARRSR